MVMATRRPGDDLGTPLGGTADQVGGMMLAYAILAALLHRERAATQPSAYWLQRLVEAGIPCTLTQDYNMLVQDPQALDGLLCPEGAVLDVPQHGVQF
jgi:crotonobetainyl-CoA:carnitine CoA-transferase CaiB-like acyl-CoA transferase